MALSASAPPPVAEAIEKSFMHAINLYYSSQKRDLASLASVLSKARRPAEVPKTIIFCRTKNDAAKVYALLLKSAYYTVCPCTTLPLPKEQARKVFNRRRA